MSRFGEACYYNNFVNKCKNDILNSEITFNITSNCVRFIKLFNINNSNFLANRTFNNILNNIYKIKL